MGFQMSDYFAMKARLEKTAPVAPTSQPVDQESKLHADIIEFCDTRWPRWKYIHARMDKKSCIQVGAQDFTIFLPDGRFLLVECKARGGKLDPDQQIWRKEMEMIGHTVHTIWSMDEFLALL